MMMMMVYPTHWEGHTLQTVSRVVRQSEGRRFDSLASAGGSSHQWTVEGSERVNDVMTGRSHQNNIFFLFQSAQAPNGSTEMCIAFRSGRHRSSRQPYMRVDGEFKTASFFLHSIDLKILSTANRRKRPSSPCF